jgi:hypothetical protein
MGRKEGKAEREVPLSRRISLFDKEIYRCASSFQLIWFLLFFWFIWLIKERDKLKKL